MMKLSAAHKAHLPLYITKDEETLADFLSDFDTARMTKGVLKLTAGKDSSYYYRGLEITQDESVPTGYYGRWHSTHHWDDSLENVKKHLDNLLAKSGTPF